jgi:hypothetical protein
MGMICGNYITNATASGGVCLVCGGFFAWEGISQEEKGVCLECVAHSDAIMRQKRFDEITGITSGCTKVWILESDCLNSATGRPPSGDK